MRRRKSTKRLSIHPKERMFWMPKDKVEIKRKYILGNKNNLETKSLIDEINFRLDTV